MGESATALVVPEVMPAGPLAVWEDPAALQAKLDRYAATRKVFVDWLMATLVPGVDWQLIHRKIGPKGNKRECPHSRQHAQATCIACGGKATLCKPGAEKIAGLLNLRPRFTRDLETWEMLGSEKGMVCVRCELVDASDQVVAEGRGCRTKQGDYDDVNKTIKMVQKSAQIDATLRYAGLSELFTQDLEDAPPRAAAPRPAPAPPAPAETVRPNDEGPPPTNWDGMAQEMFPDAVDVTPEPPPRQTRVQSAAISPAKVKRMFALLHGAATAVSGEEKGTAHTAEFERLKAALHAYLTTAYGNPEFEAIHWRDYDAVCATIQEGRL